MQHYLAELYAPKPAWLALPQEERQRFFETVGAGMAVLSDLGVEAIALGRTDRSKRNAAPQQFFAIWRFDNEQALDALLSGIAASGWHDYFDTLNAAGPGTDLSGHLAQLAAV